MSNLKEIRETMVRTQDAIAANEAVLRAQGYQGVPWYLKQARRHHAEALLNIVNAIAQEESDAAVSPYFEAQAKLYADVFRDVL